MNDSLILGAAGALIGDATSRIISTASSVLNTAEKSLGAVRDTFSGVWSVARNLGSRIAAGVGQLFGVVGDALSGAWAVARRGGASVWGAIRDVLTGIGDLFTGLWDITRPMRQAAANLITSALSSLFSGVGRFFVNLWGLTSAIRQNIASTVTGWITGVGGTLRTILSELWATITTLFQGLSRGVSSLLSSAWGLIGSIPYAGPALQIGGAIAGVSLLVRGIGLLSTALGTAGNAIVAAAVNTGVWARGVAMGAVNLGRGAFGAAVSAGRSVIGGVSNFAGGIVSRGASLAGSAGGALSSGGSWLSGVASVLWKAASGVVSTILTVGHALTTLIGVGAAAGFLSKAIIDAAKSAIEFSQKARLFSAQSGLGLDRSASVLRGLSSLGIQDGPGGNAGLFRMKARAFGLPGYDSPDFAASYAERFQGLQSRGMMGQLLAGGMAKTLGLDSPEWMRTATMRPSAIREQQGFASRVNTSLGLSPAALRAYSEEIPNFLNKLGSLWEGVKMKLASTALPILQSVLGGVTSYLSQNADKISGYIEGAVQWLFVKAPLLIVGSVSTVLGAAQSVIDGVLNMGAWLMKALPEKLGGLVQWAADTLRNMAATFAEYAPILIGGVADGLASFGRMVGGWLIDFGRGIEDISTNTKNPLRRFLLDISLGIDEFLTMAREFAAQLTALVQAPTSSTKTYSELYADAYDRMGGNAAPLYSRMIAWLDSHPMSGTTSALANSGQNVINTTQGWADIWTKYANRGANGIIGRLNNGADWLDPSQGKGGNVGNQWGTDLASIIKPGFDFVGDKIKRPLDDLANIVTGYEKSLGTERQRSDRWDELIQLQRQQVGILRQSAQKGMTSVDINRALAFIAQATAEAQGRAVLSRG